MNAIQLLEKLNEKNIHIKIDNGKLDIKAPKGTLTYELKNNLKKHKIEIIKILNGTENAKQPIEPIDRAGSLTLSFSQQRLWFLNQLEDGKDTLYNMPWALALNGKSDNIALEKAFNTLIERHESLRTTFHTVDEQAVQTIADSFTLTMPVIEITETDISAHLIANANHIFTLSQGPLLQAKLLRLSTDKHILLINMHHIISDGWSIGIFNDELTHLYTAYTQGNEPSLSPLAVQYADFAHWQRQWLQGEMLEQQAAYWKTQLNGAPALLELPTDRPRPATQSYRGNSFTLSLPPELSQQLYDLSRKTGATLFMTLLTGFNILLARYSGQTDVCIGTPIANRQRPELEKLIGFFANTLVLRTQIDHDATYTELLQQVKETALSAYTHQDIPFEHLVEILKPERSLSYAPLFQVLFVLQNADDGIFSLPGLDISPLNIDSSTAKFDLLVSFIETDNYIEGTIEYSTDLFNLETIEQFFEHYTFLLKSIVENPKTILRNLPWLTDFEQKKILIDWNNTRKPYPKNHCIHHLFEQQEAKTPDAIAVIFEDQKLTYKELNQKSNQLAHYLVQHGATPDSRIGISAERSFELVVGLLGILKAGAAYVPLDPDYPKDRLAYMLLHADINTLLTQQSLCEQFSKELDIVILDDEAEWRSQDSTKNNNFTVTVKPENLAYVIFTSGSTGLPKAVAMPHSALTNLIHWQMEQSNCGIGTNTLQFSAFSFDASFQELFSTWCSGGTLVLIDEDQRRDPFALWQVIDQQRINHLFMPFIALQQLSEVFHEIEFQPIDGKEIGNSLREIFTAGEQLQITPAIRSFFQQLPQCKLYNYYGPSETHVCTALALEGPPDTWEALPTIGRPIANHRIYILDSTLQPAPVGVYGELYVGGVGLARGYLNREDLTAERFIESPFETKEEDNNGCLYKTGDLARYRADGTIEYQGRIDDQVKIRGYRIEPGEIETILTKQPGVKEAIIGIHSRSQGTQDKYLAAYIVAKEDITLEEIQQKENLKKAVQKILPEYMVPAVFIFLDSLPLTPSGKIDRKALPAPDENSLLTQDYIAPRTEVEKTLVDIWTNILKLSVEKVGINDNFFELGGHSLLATRVVSQIRKTLNIEIRIRDIFTANTIRELSALVETALVHNPLSDQEAYPLQSIDRNQPLSLSFAQQRLWFLNQFEDGKDTQYNMPWSLRLNGELDSTALEKAFNTLIDRHESLRTTFHTVDEQAVQIVADTLTLVIPVIEITESNIPAQLSENANHVFALSQGPLLQVKLLRLSTDEHVLLINMHHIISDGWSIGVFNDELTYLYTAYTQGNEPALSPLAIQYADFAHWQRQWLQDEVLDQQVAYWKNQLSGAPALLELPTDRPRPATQSYRGNSLILNLPLELSQQLHDLSHKTGSTLFMTLFTGFNILLARYSGQTDICVGTPIANRQRPELEKLIGFFVNTLVLRTQIDSEATCTDLLLQVKETALSAYAHQDIPFEHLVEALKPERSLSYTPLFQVMFVLQNAMLEAIDLPGITVSPIEIETTTAKFDLTMSVEETNAGLSVWVDYNTDIFDHSTIERMVSHYQQLLTAMASNPNKSIMGLPILSKIESQKTLFDWNSTQEDYPKGQCIHQLFEERAEKKPNNAAVIFENQQLTYQELNQRSNQLAHYLIAQGVKPEVKVGLCMERSIEMIIAILGVLKAGGAYLPIDPEYPQQRIEYLSINSGISLLLTQTKFAAIPKEQNTPYLCLDDDSPLVTSFSTINPTPPTTPANLAYIIYTSGSTGNPKGVMCAHKGLVNRLEWMQKTYQLTPNDRILQKTPFSFDVSVWEFLWPLIAGAQLVFAQPDGHKDPSYLANTINEQAITTLHFVPSMLEAFISAAPTDELPSLKRVICSGEALPPSLERKFFAFFDKVKLHNLYGPTEASIDVSFWECIEKSDNYSVPIGKPINNTQLFILDLYLNPVPPGVTGELYIGGEGLARGYLDRADLTADRFIPNPFSNEASTRLYKTGDLVRHLTDGNIEYIGRTDHQVKVRGFRIELGEIESVLTQQTGIREAIVLAHRRETEANNHYLAAYIAYDNESPEINSTLLRNTLLTQLPDYMVPSFFVLLDELPLTPNGKVDRKALPIPDAKSLLTRDFVAPQTSTEQILAAIWAELLHLPIEKISIHDNFFELGGDSILSIQIASHAHRQGLSITTRQLFEHQTIEQLAHYVKKSTREIDQEPCQGGLPLLPIQHWFFESDCADLHHYHQSFLLHVPTDFKIEFLHSFITMLYQRHDVLRLQFTKDSNALWHPEFAPFKIELINNTIIEEPLIGKTAIQRQTHLAKRSELIRGCFDIENGPLIKAIYFKADKPENCRLLLIIHHLVVDGVSWRVLFDDLALAFEQWQSDTPLALIAKTSSFQQWATKLAAYSISETLAEEKNYWLTMLSPTPSIPVDHSVLPSDTWGDTQTINIQLNKTDTQALLNNCHQAYHTQINDILLSALLLAFFRWRGLAALTLHMEGHGREDLFDDTDLTGTIGWFTSLYPLQLSLPETIKNQTLIEELIKAVKEQYRAVPNKGIGYGLLRYMAEDEEIAAAEQDLNHTIVFNYLGQFDQQLSQQQAFYHAQENAGSDITPTLPRADLLGFNGSVINGCLQFSLDYNHHQYRRETMAELGQAYKAALKDVISHCQLSGVGSFTSSDFPLANLSQADVDDWQQQYPHLADIYPATGMQAGLLFHNFLEGNAAYVVQITWELQGELAANTLKQAWDSVIARHASLRTAFGGLGREQLLQLVVDQVELPWTEVDWRGLSDQKQASSFETYRLADKAKGFATDQAPLMRCALFRETDNSYRFLWTQHHGIMDGWCLPIILDEVMACYKQRLAGLPMNLPTASPYRNYIQWLQLQDKQAAKDFWQQQLQGIIAPTEMGVDKLPVDITVTGPQIHEYQLSKQLTSELQQIARRYRITLNTLMQAAWAYVLHRYSGDETVIFGETVSGRPADLLHSEQMVGLFINTQPVCIVVDDNADIETWLQQLHQLQAQRTSYSYLPLIEIEACSKITSGHNSFNTLMAFENYPMGETFSDNTEESNINVLLTNFEGFEETHYDLSLSFYLDENLHIKATYKPGTYTPDTIESTVQHITQVLTGLTGQTISRVGDIPLLTETESRKILVDWNNTEVDYPTEKCIHQLFEAQVEKAPNAIAAVFENQQLTYKELNQKSNQLAHYLIAQGVGPEVKVGLCVERSLEMIIGILGIVKAGGAYVPIDPEYPQQRIDYLIEDSGIVLVLTQAKLANTVFKNQSIAHFSLDQAWNVIKNNSTENPTITVTPDNLIYVIYTSGSTGKPKGVLINHSAYLNHMQWMLRSFKFTTHDRVLQKTPLSFDASGWEWSLPLLSGAQLFIAKPGGHRDPEYLLDLIDRHQITVFQGVPSLVNVLLEQHQSEKLRSLNYLFCGGEPLSVHLCNSFKAQGLPTTLCNLYGPTEASIDTTYWVFDPDKPFTTVPIGRPIDNAQLYLLDAQLNPVPIGVIGELYIGGSGLARGYLHRDDLTKEAFITHSFDSKTSTRLYRSGDLARYFPDGTIDYVGRIDDQVKVRGFRIELGEIENALMDQDDIREAVVLAYRHEGDAANHYLAAYLVHDENSSETDQTVLRTALKTQLPEYMIPSFFIELEALPLTPNGKIDRKALPAPDKSTLLTQGYIAPRSEMESILIDIWADILKLSVDKLGINDNFFELGGHSLLATRVVSQIHKILNIDIRIRDIFTANTVRDLSALVEAALVHSPFSNQEAYPLQAIDRNQSLSLSFAQQRLWFLNQFEDGEETQYNTPWGLRLNGKLDNTALEKAFNTLIERHESLRTTFHTVDEQTVQVIADIVALTVPVVEITESCIPSQVDANANHIFALSQGPLLKVKLLRISIDEHILLINMHHIISDGWSIGVFNHELTHLYTAYTQGNEPYLLPLAVQYADFAHWQRQWLQGDVLEQQVTYWKTHLSGAPTLLELPIDRPRPATQSYRGNSLTLNLPLELSQQLHDLSRQVGATLFMTLFTGFNILLVRYSGQTDICIGTPIANRQRPELEKLIGFFVNTLVLRTQIDSSTTCTELLQQVKETALSAYAHQDIPFEYLVEALQPERSLSYAPLFQVMFVLQNAGHEAIEFPGITVSPIDSEVTTAKFDLTMGVEETSAGLSVWVNYNTDIFDHSTIEQMSNHYHQLLKSMVGNPNQRVTDLLILNEVERQQILIDWNNTEASYSKELCIHQLFEEQAENTPDATAVVFENQQLTYQELNQRSNQLAHYLIAQGVGPEVKVGLCMERSLEMIIGLLGILKAGGAYVPIDPEYPQQRIDYLIDDSGIVLILTQAELANTTLKDQTIPHFSLDQAWDFIKHFSIDNPAITVIPDNLIYVIYTSGSTGKPKGVLINHSAYLNHMQWMLQKFTFTAYDRVLQKTPLSFDASGWEWSLPLISGAQLIIAKPEGHRDPDYLLDIIDRHQITVFQGVPSLVNVLLEHHQSEKLRSLNYLFCGGEPLSIHLCNSFKSQGLSTTLCNLYGPTEASIDTTYWVFDPNKLLTTVPIGRPIDNAQLYLLDTQRNPVPIGVIGELYIGGSGLARGYLNRDDLTKEAFITHSFDGKTSTRLYRSGDLARYGSDGSIEYVGRIDDQVKVRGFRIELGEIENALMDQDGIREAVVLAYRHEEDTANHYLAGYLVHDENSSETDQTVLRTALKTQLPEYMIPSFFIDLEALPLTPNGKIDRKALPEPDASNLFTQHHIAPRTEIEKAFVEIWADILKLPNDKIGIEDNFFELGGHSLLATKLTGPLRKVCGQDIPLRALFDYPTIASLVAAIDRNELTINSNILVNLNKEAVLDPSICATNAKHPVVDIPSMILLTGATGFIGRFLLCELLQQTSAQIVCLVRGKNKQKDKQQAFERLKSCLIANDLWHADYSSRIDVVVGDIGQPRFGLSEKAFISLAESIDVIYHNATAMNHIASYHALKAATVGGVQEILRLACTHRLKPVHYSSTVSIFSYANNHNKLDHPGELDNVSHQERTVNEWSSIDYEQHKTSDGYTSSKWVAEKFIMFAQARGIPCRTYRFGLVTGDTQQGRYDTDQWLYRLIASSIQIGCYPTDYSPAIGLLPVDIAAKSLVFLSRHTQQNTPNDQVQNTFHLNSPHTLDICRFFEVYNQTYGEGEPLKALTFNQWIQKLKQFAEGKGESQDENDSDRDVSIYPLMLQYANMDNIDQSTTEAYPITHMQNQSTLALLLQEGIGFPVIDQPLIETYLQFIVGVSNKQARTEVIKND